MAASGTQAEAALKIHLKIQRPIYLCIEGSVPTGADDGVYCMIGGKTSMQILEEVAEKNAAAVIVWVVEASNGCVQSAKPNQPLPRPSTNWSKANQ